ncbi:endonuclease/exonuclease/phosphatase family protein [Gilvimarinus sp. DA14]|uniref:endonuclease/exonuclease/phosphatase family protein n=1 Tax=Gilvimarinus sp. DA14 TaxID=2956798 RepID=UPI0020B7599D|nr:endonuclease/exonuclease/phosphatase family protein [Gilvimarinus sp. DA14]UTF58643.1 endonuclease/exonuclease/phosphatase family protein [Gilvimarinus sp. DA14]
MLTFFSVLTLVLLLATLIPLLKLPYWPIRVLDFPRLQIACLWAGLIAVELFTLPLSSGSTWLLLTLAAAGLARQLWWIIPYTRLASTEVRLAGEQDKHPTIKLLTANVLTPNRQAEKLLEQIREHRPDIVVTLESDLWWQQQLDSLEPDYPYTVKCPLDNLYGMHVYSRLPLHDARLEYLVEEDKPSVHAQVELADGHRVRCHFLHPAPPSPTENSESSERDAELLVVARKLRGYQGPVIVTGDLNDVAWSITTRAFRTVSGLLDPRIGRGMFNTFHANYKLLRWPLDHIFHSDHFSLVRMFRLKPFGSDHFALFTELALTPSAREQQDAPSADQEELELARDKLKSESVSPADVPKPGN